MHAQATITVSVNFPQYSFSSYPNGGGGCIVMSDNHDKALSPRECFPNDECKIVGIQWELCKTIHVDLFESYMYSLKSGIKSKPYLKPEIHLANVNHYMVKLSHLIQYDETLNVYYVGDNEYHARTKEDAAFQHDILTEAKK